MTRITPTRMPWQTCVTALAVAAFWATFAADAVAQGSAATDRAALEALYDSTNGQDWIDSTNWKTAASLDQWYGVRTDRGGRVTDLDLPANALTGVLPQALGNLTELTFLNFDNNDLAGPIPVGLAGLANLEWLDLSGNVFTGPIPPRLGNLTQLRRLELGFNELTGPVPPELGGLLNLERLGLGGNYFEGSIPASLGNLTRLRELDIILSNVTGAIPVELGKLASLEWLTLWGNALTGPIPAELGKLANLGVLALDQNALTGPIPASLANLTRLRQLGLNNNDLTGPIPTGLGRLANLAEVDLSHNWSLSGPLPSSLESSNLRRLDIFATQACAPAAWRAWLKTIEFLGPQCGTARNVTIDVAVVYTPAAREAEGGTAAIEAVIDLVIARSNEAYAASGIDHRLALVARSEVPYVETGEGGLDLYRLAEPSDGHLDEAHAIRDRTGADLVSLMVAESDVCGIADLAGPFSLTIRGCAFTHELGHNMGLYHERYEAHGAGQGWANPAYGYVNQRAFEAGASLDAGWVTIMAYGTQCNDAGITCVDVPRFSNPRQYYKGDPLGVAYGEGGLGVAGPADAAAVINATGPAVALWRDRPEGANRPPVTMGTLPDREMTLRGALDVDASRAFVDPDGDALTYAASSSAPNVVAVRAAGGRVTLTAVGAGTARVRVTATDPGGLSASQAFTVTVTAPIVRPPFTDDPLRPGVTPVRAVHFTELRERIDAVRAANGLGRFGWTDPALRAGATGIRRVHLMELRSALAAAYTATGRPVPRWTDPAPVAGSTLIRVVHLTELRAAVVALE